MTSATGTSSTRAEQRAILDSDLARDHRDIIADPLGPIWIQPIDYRNVTAGTPFFNEHPSRRFEFRRQAERELFVASQIRKHRLLES